MNMNYVLRARPNLWNDQRVDASAHVLLGIFPTKKDAVVFYNNLVSRLEHNESALDGSGFCDFQYVDVVPILTFASHTAFCQQEEVIQEFCYWSAKAKSSLEGTLQDDAMNSERLMEN